MKLSIKSLLVTTAVVALIYAVAIVSYRRGRQDERDTVTTGDWTIEEIVPSTPNTAPSSGNWVIEN